MVIQEYFNPLIKGMSFLKGAVVPEVFLESLNMYIGEIVRDTP
jgi:hypothetical protein